MYRSRGIFHRGTMHFTINLKNPSVKFTNSTSNFTGENLSLRVMLEGIILDSSVLEMRSFWFVISEVAEFHCRLKFRIISRTFLIHSSSSSKYDKFVYFHGIFFTAVHIVLIMDIDLSMQLMEAYANKFARQMLSNSTHLIGFLCSCGVIMC